MLDFQGFLDAIVDAVRVRDFEAFEPRYALPVTVIAAQGTYLIEDRGDLLGAFDGYIAALDGHGVTDYVRVSTSLTRIAPTLAAGTYETHLLRNGTRVAEPFASAVLLRHDDGEWRATTFMVALTQERWRFRLPGTDDAAQA